MRNLCWQSIGEVMVGSPEEVAEKMVQAGQIQDALETVLKDLLMDYKQGWGIKNEY